MLDTYQPALFVPHYRPIQHGNWQIRQADMVLCKGYWSPTKLCLNMAALIRTDADGTIHTWMSMTPMEIESQQLGCLHASGHVVIMGMGMGWCAAAAAVNKAVARVTVVELDQDVLDMIDTLGVFDQLPDDARAKIHIVKGSAYDYVPDRPVDLLMPDIWLPLMNDGRVEEVRAMQAHCRATRIYFWGQEMEIARHARLWGLTLDADGVAATVARFDLPLLIPDDVDYPTLIKAAADNWMGDRWFAAAA